MDYFASDITTELLKQLIQTTRRSSLSKERALQLIRIIEDLQPIIREILYSGFELPGDRQTQLEHFSRTLVEGLELSRKVLRTNSWNLLKNLQFTKKMEKLDKKINHFLHFPMQAHTLAGVHRMRTETMERLERIEASTRLLAQSLSELRIGSGGWVEEAPRQREETEAESDAFGSGGSGKTTLAEEVAKDDAIRSTPQPVEELEICSDDIEPGPPEYCSRKVLMRGGLGLMEPPEVTQWQTNTEIYLMENLLTELPKDPWCPVLLFLFLNRNYKLRKISQSFFDYMPAPEILNLSRTQIKSLPESIFRLSSLKRLFLTHCELLMVLPPETGELQQLEVLDLEGTKIMDLPQEVAKLTKLTCLKLSFCPRVNQGTKSAKVNALIPQGTLSALSQLEELSIDVNPKEERWESVVEAIVDEVCGLLSMDTLKLYLPRVEHLRKFKWFGTSMLSRSLSHFKFIVGSHDECMSCLPVDLEFEIERWDRSLKYVNGMGIPIDIQKMLRHTIAFFLDYHVNVMKLSDFGIENMEQLKCCIIGECNEIQVIIDGTDIYDEADRSEIVLESWEDDKSFLGLLEYLYVYHMKSLRPIYDGPMHRGCLSHLKSLALLTYPQLTTIFTPGLLKNLDSLEELNVEDFPLVLSLVTCEDTSIYESTHFLPNLKRISLFKLPELISISNGLRIAPNLERMSISDCLNLKSTSTDGICCNHPTVTKANFVDNVSSTWELLNSFGPQEGPGGDEDSPFRPSNKEDWSDGDDEKVSKERISPRKDDLDSHLSTSVEDKESTDKDEVGKAPSANISELVRNVSPKGSFRRRITSWQKGEWLGSGSFGTVYEGISDDGFFFAIKEVSLLDQGSQGKQSILQLEQEISLLSQFEHENIVRYLGTDKDDKKLYIFLELMTKGSLATLYHRYNLRDSQVSAYTRQILNGLKYLHDQNVVHRDIKCANILVDANGSVKLADFGLAKATKMNDAKSSKGTAFWMAPEVVNLKNRGYGLAADIWSLGCTVLEMSTCRLPYSPLEGMQALFRIGRGELPPVPDSLSRDVRDLILRCLQVNPNDRPSAAELLDHPFVRKPPTSSGFASPRFDNIWS